MRDTNSGDALWLRPREADVRVRHHSGSAHMWGPACSPLRSRDWLLEVYATNRRATTIFVDLRI